LYARALGIVPSPPPCPRQSLHHPTGRVVASRTCRIFRLSPVFCYLLKVRRPPTKYPLSASVIFPLEGPAPNLLEAEADPRSKLFRGSGGSLPPLEAPSSRTPVDVIGLSLHFGFLRRVLCDGRFPPLPLLEGPFRSAAFPDFHDKTSVHCVSPSALKQDHFAFAAISPILLHICSSSFRTQYWALPRSRQ